MRHPMSSTATPARLRHWRSAALELALIIGLPLAVLLAGAVVTAEILPVGFTPPIEAKPSKTAS